MKYIILTKAFRELNDSAQERLREFQEKGFTDVQELRSEEGLTMKEIETLGLPTPPDLIEKIRKASVKEIIFLEDEYERKTCKMLIPLGEIHKFEEGEEYTWIHYKDIERESETIKETIEEITKLLN